MTWIFWLFLLVVMVALAVATALRRKPAARISDAQRLPPPPRTDRDDNAGLGLSTVRPVSAGQAVPASPRPASAATPDAGASAAARPASAPPPAEPAASGAWMDEVLEDVLSEEEPGASGPTLDAETLDPATLAEPSEPVVPLDSSDASDEPEATPHVEAADDTVWTFDAAAATPVPATTAYVRTGQTLWPAGPDPAALLMASLASRLGGTAAVVRHDGPTYTVEMLAGARLGAEPAPMEAEGHPLHRVPQDNVLSLLGDGDGAALTYHADPETMVGQALARTLAAPPAARVLLVVGVPPGAPDIDRETAALVDHYAALLADLTFVPASPEAAPEDQAWDEAWESAVADAGPAASFSAGDVDTELAEDADAAPDPAEDDVLLDADGQGPGRAADMPRTVEAVAQPGARRSAPPPPPRAVILNAEIDAARRDRRLLVFALVTLADSETIFGDGADGVVRAEAALRERLAAAPAVRRVEPFGDLVFGAFLDAEGPEVVKWAERLSSAGRPLLVGAVPAVGEADMVRQAAMDALQSAYEREVVCVIAT